MHVKSKCQICINKETCIVANYESPPSCPNDLEFNIKEGEIIKNYVTRTFSREYTVTTEKLEKMLNEGWIVKMATPFVSSVGKTDYIEYILEKAD